MKKSVSLRVRLRYFEEIVAGTKRVEYRAFKDYWTKRLLDPDLEVAVFVSGSRVHRRAINQVNVIPRPHNFSDQGKQDVPTEQCFAILLGEEITDFCGRCGRYVRKLIDFESENEVPSYRVPIRLCEDCHRKECVSE